MPKKNKHLLQLVKTIFRRNHKFPCSIASTRAFFITKTGISILTLLAWTAIYSQAIKGQAIDSDSTIIIKIQEKHSPQKASFYSAVLPGLGQIYNKKYWKVPIIYAGASVIGYYYIFNNNKYNEYKSNYLRKLANDPNNPPDEKFKYASPERIKYYMEYWRRNRDYLAIGMVALYVANIIDATVDAYLFDYDISQDLSMKIKPALYPQQSSLTLGLSCTFRF